MPHQQWPAASMPPNRGPSGGHWGRLKPAEQDPLDSIGLPSKGDTRLLDAKTQERYYTKIVERYLSFCSDATSRDSLLQRFASLDLTERSHAAANATTAPAAAAIPAPSASSAASQASGRKDLSDVLMALRKLREGIVATKRADDFAVQAYLFCIRTAVLAKQPDSYHPAALHLLRAVHPRHPLTDVELAEVAALLVLDAACRRGELSEAHVLRRRYRLRDAKVDAALAAVARDNWVAFRRVKRSVDRHRACLMEFAEEELRVHTLKCFGRTYLDVDVGFLELAAGRGWDDLKALNGVGWELDGRRVAIRKIKARP